MSYIGNQPFNASFLVDTFSGTGSAVSYTMTIAPAGSNSLFVIISGVVQPPSAYSVVGTTITFSSPPPIGTNNIVCRYLALPASNVTTSAYRAYTELTATAGQTVFTPAAYTPGFIDVYRNGVKLNNSSFQAQTGSVVVLNTAANAGDSVVIISFYISSVLNAIPNTAGAVGVGNYDISGQGGTGALQLPTGSTVQRPSSPSAGMTRFNSTLKYPEWYDSNTGIWVPFIYTSGAYTVNYIVVAGGGSGNQGYINDVNEVGGGGGGGGLITGTVTLSIGQTLTSTIGAGGSFIANYQNTAPSGGNSTLSGSTISTVTTLGGGGGGMQSRSGGSGGSGGGGNNGSGYAGGGAGTTGQGFKGGDGYNTTSYNCGGGGATGAGSNTVSSGSYGGTGYTAPFGTTYATGGGYNTGQGTAYTGNGGGGAYYTNAGASGGSGVVVIYYSGSQRGTGGVITSANGYTIHTFQSAGTFTA